MPPTTEPPAPAAATVSPETFRADAVGAAPKDLNALLGHAPGAKVAGPDGRLVPATPPPLPAAAPAPAPAAAPAPAPAAAAPAATPAAAPAADPAAPAPADPAAAPADGDEFRLAKNWRLAARDAQEAQFFLLLRQGKTPIEATKEVYGTATPPPAAPTATPAAAPAAPAPEAPPTKEIDDQIAALETEVTTLTGQIDQALDKEADTKTALRLKDQQFDKKIALAQLKQWREAVIAQAEEARVEATVAEFQRARVASTGRVSEAYPALAIPTSPERALFNQTVESMRNDPAQASIFHSPKWPEIVASMLAVEQGWTRSAAGAPRAPAAAPAPAPAAAPSAAAVRATSAALVTPGDPSSQSSFVPTEADLRAAAAISRPEDLNKLLAGPTPKIPARR